MRVENHSAGLPLRRVASSIDTYDPGHRSSSLWPLAPPKPPVQTWSSHPQGGARFSVSRELGAVSECRRTLFVLGQCLFVKGEWFGVLLPLQVYQNCITGKVLKALALVWSVS